MIVLLSDRAWLGNCFYPQLLLLLPLLTGSCGTTHGPVLPNLEAAAPVTESVAAHSPSALEALSRGVALVTPANAALQDVYYEFDSTELAPAAADTLKQNAEWMKAHPAARVEVEGHCDDIGSAEYNLALGAKRAQVAKDFLVNQGVAPERLVTISYGKEAPACFEPTEDCRVKNRRARFVTFTELPTS